MADEIEATKPLILERYPWQEEAWGGLDRLRARLPHALLFSGQPGIGKRMFALRFAQSLLCAEPEKNGEACGRCRGCGYFRAGTHPDLLLVEPAEAGRAILVDQVRSIAEFLALTPHTAARKIVVIAPAEAMNLNAANGLLKQLEEPPAGGLMLLVTNRPTGLPATVRSRCVRVALAKPRGESAVAWLRDKLPGGEAAPALLQLAHGAPLTALALAQDGFAAKRVTLLDDLEAIRKKGGDVVGCAQRWKEIGVEACLLWLQTLVADLIRLRMSQTAAAGLANADQSARLQALGKRIQLKELFNYFDQVSDTRAVAQGPLDANLLLEGVLVRWARLAA